jgi:hypothetical protein
VPFETLGQSVDKPAAMKRSSWLATACSAEEIPFFPAVAQMVGFAIGSER